MSLLDKEEARLLLEDATLDAATVRGCSQRITRFLQRYLPLFYRCEQRENATLVIQGRLSGLERKTSEPIAIQAGVERKPVQQFVGAGCWDDEAVTAELRRHVAEELADPDAVFVLDPVRSRRRGPSRAAWRGNGADAWARWTTARSECSWRSPRRAARRCWTGGCTCLRSGPRIRRAARSVTCRASCGYERSGGSGWTFWTARGACRTAG